MQAAAVVPGPNEAVQFWILVALTKLFARALTATFHEEHRHGNARLHANTDRGPRAGRLRQARLRSLAPLRGPDAGGPVEGRTEPPGQGSRLQKGWFGCGAGGGGGRFDWVEGAGRLAGLVTSSP